MPGSRSSLGRHARGQPEHAQEGPPLGEGDVLQQVHRQHVVQRERVERPIWTASIRAQPARKHAIGQRGAGKRVQAIRYAAWSPGITTSASASHDQR